ncbi:MAG: squalene synthase HpnC [Burkholderiales bacterium]|nr:squalene synthase HpnC [Burkholderiales bacterium]
MTVGHYENFPVASRLVPATLRPAIVAIYRFARAADDLADEGDAPPAERIAALAAFGCALDAIEAGAAPDTPPFAALAAAIRAHDLPLAPLRDLLSAFTQDVTTARYATYADVADYCRRSANPVGRLLLALYRADRGAEAGDNLAASDAVCTGLQLANFWQDVAIDWRKGRVYLPQEDLARFGVTVEHIAHARADARWRALMAFETARARALLQSGHRLARRLPWRLRLELAAVIAGGTRILDRIDAVGGDVYTRRPALRALDWCAVAFRAVVPPRHHPFAEPRA